MLTHINVGAILSVHVLDQKKSTDYEWFDEEPEIKGWFGRIKSKIRPAGFYRTWGGSDRSNYTPEEILEGYRHQETQYRVDLIEKAVFRKPFVNVKSLGGKYVEETNVFFDSYSEALAYAESISAEFPHITIKK